MNNRKRNIILQRCNFVKKLASQITEFKYDEKMLNKWYTDYCVTPLRAANIIKNMKTSKLHSIYHIILAEETNNYVNIHGNIFTVKFLMCCKIAGLDDSSGDITLQYCDWIKKNYQK